MSILKQMIATNGVVWTLHVGLYVLIRKVRKDCRIPFLDRRIKNMEKKHGLPGINCPELNCAIWNGWNWERKAGEEWTLGPEWKQALVDHVLHRYIDPGLSTLEIGPGAGRWTGILADLAGDLAVVDISRRCVEICREKFAHLDNITYYTTPGSSLGFLTDESIDRIWSYDTFVHIAPKETEEYIGEFARVLRKGGRAVIHHAKEGGLHGGWRSSMTDRLFAEMLAKHGLTLEEQFDSWGDEGQFHVRHYHDIFSVFRR